MLCIALASGPLGWSKGGAAALCVGMSRQIFLLSRNMAGSASTSTHPGAWFIVKRRWRRQEWGGGTRTSADLCLAPGHEEMQPFPGRNPQDLDPTLHRGSQTQRSPLGQVPQNQRGPGTSTCAHVCAGRGVSLTNLLLSCHPRAPHPQACRLSPPAL